jgi:hypothetical protein
MRDEKRRGRRDRAPVKPDRHRAPVSPPGEGTLPAEDVVLPPPEPCDVRDAPQPEPARRPPVIHERRPAPRVPDEDEREPREPP